MERLLLCFLIALMSGNTIADSFRCGRRIVKTGESSNALVKKCGEPLRKISSKELVRDQGRHSRVAVSNWVYERKGKNDMIVSIRGGTVVRIQVD